MYLKKKFQGVCELLQGTVHLQLPDKMVKVELFVTTMRHIQHLMTSLLILLKPDSELLVMSTNKLQ